MIDTKAKKLFCPERIQSIATACGKIKNPANRSLPDFLSLWVEICNREKVVVQLFRLERACKRTGKANVPFRGRGTTVE